jgi:hypothetical protein
MCNTCCNKKALHVATQGIYPLRSFKSHSNVVEGSNLLRHDAFVGLVAYNASKEHNALIFKGQADKEEHKCAILFRKVCDH